MTSAATTDFPLVMTFDEELSFTEAFRARPLRLLPAQDPMDQGTHHQAIKES
jgi:hypothetical protein